MKYRVNYYFDGRGEVIIDAKNKEEAEKIFKSGEWENEKEWCDDSYTFDSVEED